MKSMILKKLMFLLVFISGNMMFAQITVTGVISDANGPVPGVNVLVRGTSNGAVSDFDGNYTISNVPEDATLIFSYVGFQTKAVEVNGKTTINVTMEENAAELEAVVVIGYGTQSIKDATGAVAVVTSEDFNQGVIASPEQLIQGKTAGVQITQSSGEPGAGIAVRIRGANSVRPNNSPLFVVDGVPLSGGSAFAGNTDLGFGTSSGQNPLNFLNPNDIESVSILKDASATAIYGSRGANGVVIITTKAGRGANKGVFELTSSLSISGVRKRLDLLSASEFRTARENLFTPEQNSGVDFGASTDWQDQIFRRATSQNQSLSYTQSFKDGGLRASFNYGKQFGVVQKSALERITGRINANYRFFEDKLKIGVQGTLSRVNDQRPPVSNNAGFQGDLLGAAYSANPTWPADPNFSTGGSEINPLNLLLNTQNEGFTNRYLGNLSAEYFILPELSAKVTLGIDKSDSQNINVVSGDINGITNGGVQGNGLGAFSDQKFENRLLEATLNYTKEFENSKLEAIAGYSFQDFKNEGINGTAWGFSSSNVQNMAFILEDANDRILSSIDGSFQQYAVTSVPGGIILPPDDRLTGAFVNRLFPEPLTADPFTIPSDLGVSTIVGDSFNNTDELQSFFVRGTYTLNDKYILTATLRADGSSRFGPDNEYGYFPSAAFAWKLDQEDFIPESFSTLKLRLGYGITGNQDGLGFGNFTIRRRFGGLGINQNGETTLGGTNRVSFQDDGLKWEEETQYNLGIDFGFMNDRLTGSIDVYRRNTEDLILQTQTAQPSPTPFNFTNFDANVINQGIEFAINYGILDQEDLSLDFGFNISYNQNEVQNFDGLIPSGALNGQGLTGSFVQLLAEDQPLFSYFLREFTGFVDGQATYEGGSNNIQFVGKSALPDFIMGTNLNFRYKNFDASAFLAGQFGHYVYNATGNALFTAGSFFAGRNITGDVLTSGEGFLNNPDPSTLFLEKADFVRLQNASIGYNVKLSGEGLFKSMRWSLNGQNLFVITDYSGLDPEVSTDGTLNNIPTAGIDYTAFPRPTTVTLGLNVTF